MLWNHYWSCIFTFLYLYFHEIFPIFELLFLLRLYECMVRQFVLFTHTVEVAWLFNLWYKNVFMGAYGWSSPTKLVVWVLVLSPLVPCAIEIFFYWIPCENSFGKYFNPLWFEFKNTKPKDCAKLTKGYETFLQPIIQGIFLCSTYMI